MMNTPGKFILMRIFLFLFGRFDMFSKIFKKALIKFLITKSKKKYVSSSKFFDWEDLE